VDDDLSASSANGCGTFKHSRRSIPPLGFHVTLSISGSDHCWVNPLEAALTVQTGIQVSVEF
jgi:hypothetical protein